MLNPPSCSNLSGKQSSTFKLGLFSQLACFFFFSLFSFLSFPACAMASPSPSSPHFLSEEGAWPPLPPSHGKKAAAMPSSSSSSAALRRSLGEWKSRHAAERQAPPPLALRPAGENAPPPSSPPPRMGTTLSPHRSGGGLAERVSIERERKKKKRRKNEQRTTSFRPKRFSETCLFSISHPSTPSILLSSSQAQTLHNARPGILVVGFEKRQGKGGF